VALLVALSAGPARADDVADFNAMTEIFAQHGRAALSDLRRRDAARLAADLDEMRHVWADIDARFGKARPEPFRRDDEFQTLLVDVAVRLVGTELVLSMGNATAVQRSLTGIRNALSSLRRHHGIEVLADCILDANDAFATLDAETRNEPVSEGRLQNYNAILQRCDALAPPDIKASALFRRMIDGARMAVEALQESYAKRDAGEQVRALSKLRSFDEELTLHFG
jgi:hypothetical protein